MGAPAGLKLNSVLSQSLGKFFLYHIHLWVTFLYVITPYLSDVVYRAMFVLSWLGFCFQVCIKSIVKNEPRLRLDGHGPKVALA